MFCLIATLLISSTQGFYLDPTIQDDLNILSSTTSPLTKSPQTPTVGYFLRNLGNATLNTTIHEGSSLPSSLHGLTHYRLLPAVFPDKMGYHFDGLATVLKFHISDDGSTISYRAKTFEDEAATDFKKCIFYGTGYGPTLGTKICFTNPGVNLLPIDGQLWLTIDTSKWGRVDPETLDTIKNDKGTILQPTFVNSSSLVLNAHPACDRQANICYVQHPCPKGPSPYSDQICFSVLRPNEKKLNVELVARATMKKSKIIQHSHSPCLTEHYVVSKVDAFVGRNPLNKNGGLLKFLHQGEDSLWFVLNRLTNETTLITGTDKFVNNHFWNCYEDDQGKIVVETVASTEDYLDTYFARNLARSHPDWSTIFYPALRCHLSVNTSSIECVPLLKSNKKKAGTGIDVIQEESLLFDYPTFNPHYKKKTYQYFYAISITSNTSAWFDKLIKVDVHTDTITKSWSSPNIFMTEFDFVPTATEKSQNMHAEDDGVLLSVLYNATDDTSLFAIFNASTIEPIGIYPMEHSVPFHAHGIICKKGIPCFTNP